MTTELVELADRLKAFTRVSESGRSDDGIEGAIIPGKDCYDFDDDMMAAATAIRALASRAAVPDGFVLVPREPTWAMYEAWAARCEITGKGIVYKGNWGNWKYNYTEMLAAAPEPVAVGS